MNKDPFGYKATKKYCNDHNNTLTYQQMKPCAEKGKHSFANYTRFKKFNLVGTCTVCGYKQVIDGNI